MDSDYRGTIALGRTEGASMRKSIFSILSFAFMISVAGASPIELTCKDKRTVGFRDESSIKSGPEWGDENFYSSWSIKYDGISDQGYIDGKLVAAIKGNGTVILVDYSANQYSQSLWAWAIHLSQRKVTAARVNVYDLQGVGVKSGSVEFDCE